MHTSAPSEEHLTGGKGCADVKKPGKVIDLAGFSF
jgi:hypothetical protein